jgi:hypothetical protein
LNATVKRKRKRSEYYVNNKEFFAALVEFQDKVKVDPQYRISDFIGSCIMKICEKLSKRWNFADYSFRTEMRDQAILKCIEAVHKFNPEKTNNPFGYFTQIAWNVYINKIEMEATEHYTMHLNLENMSLFTDELFSEMKGDDTSKVDGVQRHYDILKKFEDKQAKKKARQKKLKVEAPKLARVGANKGKH